MDAIDCVQSRVRLAGSADASATAKLGDDDMTDTWTLVDGARTDLGDYLETLTLDQWDAPTLCEGWTVRDVVGHVVEGSLPVKKLPIFLAMARNGFDINRALFKMAIKYGQRPPEDLMKGVRETVGMRTTGGPSTVEDMLADWVVHTQDIRRVLGPPGTVPAESVLVLLDRMKDTGKIMGNKERIEGLKLVTTDMEWTHGDGPEVRGLGEAVLMGMCGRKSVLDELTGDGVAVLRSRN